MEKYRKAFPHENIYVHNPFITSVEYTGYRYKYVFIWRALTPTGRISKYFHAELTNKWQETNFYPLPKLKKGYTWMGPYLYDIYKS